MRNQDLPFLHLNDDELKKVNEYFNARLPKYTFDKLGFREKLWLIHQALNSLIVFIPKN